jgi:hypothetical protein
MPMSPESAVSTETAIRDAERELAGLQGEIEQADVRLKRLAIQNNRSAFDALQGKREQQSRAVVRLQLRLQGLHERHVVEQEAAKAARRQQLEQEAASLEADIAGSTAKPKRSLANN